MTINVAISGFGRIGRLVLRAIYENNYKDIKVVAVNCSRGTIEKHAHLLKYDSQLQFLFFHQFLELIIHKYQ